MSIHRTDLGVIWSQTKRETSEETSNIVEKYIGTLLLWISKNTRRSALFMIWSADLLNGVFFFYLQSNKILRMPNMACFLFFRSNVLRKDEMKHYIKKTFMVINMCYIYIYLYQWIYLMLICIKLEFNLKYVACYSLFIMIYMACYDNGIPHIGNYLTRSV